MIIEKHFETNIWEYDKQNKILLFYVSQLHTSSEEEPE
jgi:hypothetical protein